MVAKARGERAESIELIARGFAYKQILRRRRRTGVEAMRLPRDPLAIAEFLGITLDPWQIRAVTAIEHDVLLLVTRQGGKGEVATMLALDKLINQPGSTTVCVARADRQARRLLTRIKRRYKQLGSVSGIVRETQSTLELENGSEVLAVPGSEETIRGIEAVDLLIVDEAALVPDALMHAVYPMLATTDGMCLAMTSARGKRGWFYKAWVGDSEPDPETDEAPIVPGSEWHREKVTWQDIPRFKPEWVARTRRRLGEFMFRQEFECEFMDDESQFYATDLVMKAQADIETIMFTPLGGD